MSKIQIPTQEEQTAHKHVAAEVRRTLNFSTYFLGNPSPSTMPTIDSSIAQRFGSEEVGSLFWPCLLAIILGIVNWHQHAFSIHTVIVAIGCAASLVIPLFLVIHCVIKIQAQSRPTTRAMAFYTVLTFAPYVFALYCIFFLGFYLGLKQFSLAQLIQSLLFIVAGHCIARKLRGLQEFQSCVYEQLNKSYGDCDSRNLHHSLASKHNPSLLPNNICVMASFISKKWRLSQLIPHLMNTFSLTKVATWEPVDVHLEITAGYLSYLRDSSVKGSGFHYQSPPSSLILDPEVPTLINDHVQIGFGHMRAHLMGGADIHIYGRSSVGMPNWKNIIHIVGLLSDVKKILDHLVNCEFLGDEVRDDVLDITRWWEQPPLAHRYPVRVNGVYSHKDFVVKSYAD